MLSKDLSSFAPYHLHELENLFLPTYDNRNDIVLKCLENITCDQYHLNGSL